MPQATPPLILVYVTAPDAATADDLARQLVQARLAACVNRHGPIRSVYWWEGAVQDDEEYVLLIKTRPDLYEKVRDFVLVNHPYQTPPVLRLDVTAANAGFVAWLNDSLAGE